MNTLILAKELVGIARSLVAKWYEFTVTHQPRNANKPYHVECTVIPASAWHESQYRKYTWDVSREQGDKMWREFDEAAIKAITTGRSQTFTGDLP